MERQYKFEKITPDPFEDDDLTMQGIGISPPEGLNNATEINEGKTSYTLSSLI